MRIVQVITRPQRRGAEIFAVQLSEELIKLGHQVTLISIFKSDQELDFSGEQINLDLDYKGKIDFQGFKILANKLKEINPEVIQANASETLRMCVGARWFFNSRYHLIYRNANQISGFLKGRLRRIWNKFLLSKVDGIVSVSEASRKDVIQTFGLQKPTITIPIGIDQAKINDSLAFDNYPITPPYLIQIGGLVPEKDPLGMVNIFKKLGSPDLKLVFLGSGPLESKLKEKIQLLGLTKQIFLVPNQSNIFPYLAKALALVMPSTVEGLPGVILEAMCCNVPVVAYGVGGISEVLRSGETGWCIHPKDSKSFVDAIQEVIFMDEKAKQNILDQAHHLVTTQFDLKIIAKCFEDFYRNLA